MSIVFRFPVITDISKIVKIQQRSQRELEFKDFTEAERFRFMLTEADLYEVWVHRFLSKGQNAYQSFVAYNKELNCLCGFIGYQCFENCGYIRSLYLNPDYVRAGIGTKLLKHALSYIFEERGLARVRLEVLEINARARAFYAHHGFKPLDFEFPKSLGGSASAIFEGKYRVSGMELIKKLA